MHGFGIGGGGQPSNPYYLENDRTADVSVFLLHYDVDCLLWLGSCF